MAKKKNPYYSVSVRLKRTSDQRTVALERRGKSTQLGITQFVVQLLQANERLPRPQKMTDETMRAAIISEYPNSKRAQLLLERKITVGYWRSIYNCGGFHPERERPKTTTPEYPKSYQYDFRGYAIDPRTRKPFRAVTDERQRLRRKKERRERKKTREQENRRLARDFEKYARQLANAFTTIAWEYYIAARNERLAQQRLERERKQQNAVPNRKNFREAPSVRLHSTSDGEVELILENKD